MDRGAWRATVCSITDATWLSNWAHTHKTGPKDDCGMNSADAWGTLKQAGRLLYSFIYLQVLLDGFFQFLSASFPNLSPNSSLQVELTKQVLLWQTTVDIISRSRD